MAKDYYSILEVPENASKEDIKKSFRTRAKKYHPDLNPGDKTAEAKFKEASEAYEVLSDTQKRQQYDTMRKYGAFGGFGGGAPGAGGPGGGQGFDFSQFKGGVRFEDLGGMGQFADLFSSIFGGEDLFSGRQRGAGSRRQRRPQPRRGNNLSIKLAVSFEEAISGTSKTIILNKPDVCTACRGTGDEPGSRQKVCDNCQGRGTVSFAQGTFAISRPCPKCLGKGVVPGTPCHNCGGSGRIKVKRKVRVKIPAGINDGGRIRLREMGNPGSNGGQNGDLIITVNAGKHQQFDRRGNDVYSTFEITYPQAVLGAKVPIKTLAKTVNLTIAPGTEHGTKLRLKGMGLAVDGSQGDQYVEIHIKVPKEPTPRQKELLEELAKTMA
jgi:molecular chaperone DnaJ